MSRIVLSFLLVSGCAWADSDIAMPRYGADPKAGHTFVHDNVELYYEIHGSGEPLLVVHGNGGSIGDLGAQIAYFSQTYQVIAMDSRDQGRSGSSTGGLTYEKMTDDLVALIEHLRLGPTHVLGWSDGGIQALLLGIRYPTRVNRIVAMAANLNPTSDAFREDVIAWLKSYVGAIPKDDPKGQRELKVASIMLDQPNIELGALKDIVAPTLIIAGDRDLIRDLHTIAIYHHIPNAQLAILPNATHMLPYDDPALFNSTVERFLEGPAVGRDRIGDLESSLEAARASQ
jgi:pimeloyl-ACP methyl ester carboxylesterase